jgi:ribonuclease J
MRKNVELADRLGILKLPEDLMIDIEDVDKYPDGEVCVLCTGSQGEPLSALALLATGENKWLSLRDSDAVVISAHPIPGNEWAVGRVVDGLHRRGAEVVHTGVEPVHVSGHARQGELKTLLSVARPEWFVPVHGEYRHLVNHAHLARAMGVETRKVLICQDGDVVVLRDDGLEISGDVPAGFLYVDGTVGDVGHGVLRDRRVLAEEGVVVVVCTVDMRARDLVADPEIVTRGWVHAPEADALIGEASEAVRAALESALADGAPDHEALARHARRALGKFVGERTRRRPMIVPVVLSL